MTAKSTPKDPALKGQGSYWAALRHRASAQALVKSGKVIPAAGAAKPTSPAQARELREAEEAGRKAARS